MAKTSEEDTPDVTEETLPEAEAVLVETEEVEEMIPDDEEGKPVPKKMAALKARHRLEDYFEMKRIQDELDYLDDEKKRKAALLQKVKASQEEKPVKDIKKPVSESKPKSPPKPKPKAKAKPTAKPKAKTAKVKPKTKKKSKK